jgi:uncharacterized membrane protein
MNAATIESMRLQNMSCGIIIWGDIAKGRAEMVDWLWIYLGLACFVAAVSAYLISVKTRNIDSKASRLMKISCTVNSVVGIMLVVLAFGVDK